MKDVIYKYLPAERTGFYLEADGKKKAGFFPNLEIAAVSPLLLNDPFECKFNPRITKEGFINHIKSRKWFEETRESQKRIGLPSDDKYLKKLRAKCLREADGSHVDFKEKMARNACNIWKLQSINYVRIISLSERKDSLLMWSHYADNHTGFVLGLKSDFLRKEDEFLNKSGWGLRKVEYNDAKPVIDVFMGKPIPQNSLPYYVKSRCWEYETEVRFVLMDNYSPIPDTRLRKKNELISIVNIEPEFLECIIFGIRMDKRQKEKIYEYCASKETLSHIKFYSAKASESKYEIEFDLQ